MAVIIQREGTQQWEVLGSGWSLLNTYIDGLDEGIKTEFVKFELALNDPRSVMIYETKIKFKMALAHWENGSTKLE